MASTSSAGLLALLAVACLLGFSLATIESNSSSLASSSLYAVWSASEVVKITPIDPTTGDAGEEVFRDNDSSVISPLAPAVDSSGKRVFIHLFKDNKSVLAVFDFSVPVKAALVAQIPLPGFFFSGLQYDPVKDRVWLITHRSDEQNYVVSVDLKAGTADKVKDLPAGVVPLVPGGLGGAPMAFDQKNRNVIFTSKSGEAAYVLERFNVDTLRFSSLALKDLFPIAMARDTNNQVIYSLFGSNVATAPLSFGTVTSTGHTVISTWKAAQRFTVAGSVATIDPAKSMLYTLASLGPSVSDTKLVSVNSKSGLWERTIGYSNATQPLGLFVL